MRGCCLLWSNDTWWVVSPGSSRGYQAGAASSLDVLENFLIFSRRELEHLCVESPGPPPYIVFPYRSDQLKPQPLAKYQAHTAPWLASLRMASISRGLTALAWRKYPCLAPYLGRMMKYLTDLVKYLRSLWNTFAVKTANKLSSLYSGTTQGACNNAILLYGCVQHITLSVSVSLSLSLSLSLSHTHTHTHTHARTHTLLWYPLSSQFQICRHNNHFKFVTLKQLGYRFDWRGQYNWGTNISYY